MRQLSAHAHVRRVCPARQWLCYGRPHEGVRTERLGAFRAHWPGLAAPVPICGQLGHGGRRACHDEAGVTGRGDELEALIGAPLRVVQA